jgi:predicted TIM-barrel fold metal-dependent hydrolase
LADTEELLCGLPLYLDTSYSQYMLDKECMQRMIGKHGAENVLFGTDSPGQARTLRSKKLLLLAFRKAISINCCI